ncbi:MAG: ATP-dependent sacrificial sulfur transferase LarE [Pseudomonadota bacterium]
MGQLGTNQVQARESRAGGAVADAVGAVLRQFERAAVAVSGGVDSVTLAALAHDVLGRRFQAFHAMSPAVPPEATARVRTHAEQLGWDLVVVDAGEFADPEYLANPVNRCYFCKRNLYDRIASVTEQQVLSGANADDLGDYRPGLTAARERAVRHPYVEAEVTKEEVRALARHLGLSDVQDLPAMPCLSSRVESGIPIRADDLAFVNSVELWLRDRLAARTARCRIGHAGVRIELDALALARAESMPDLDVETELAERCRATGRTLAGIELYARGSAFLHD